MGCNDSRPFPILSEKYIKRFWSKVDVRGPDECWLWTAGLARGGYGKFGAAGRHFQAHRLALFLSKGVDFTPLCACHSCDIRYAINDRTYRKCCNPAHLFPATGGDNQRDKKAKGRAAKGDQNGARLHPERLARGERHGSKTHPEVWANRKRT